MVSLRLPMPVEINSRERGTLAAETGGLLLSHVTPR